jgi:hypothetical protein
VTAVLVSSSDSNPSPRRCSFTRVIELNCIALYPYSPICLHDPSGYCFLFHLTLIPYSEYDVRVICLHLWSVFLSF